MLGNPATGCEFIPADRICLLYFDIELKTADPATAGYGIRWTKMEMEAQQAVERYAHS
jgi:hypothetical protein